MVSVAVALVIAETLVPQVVELSAGYQLFANSHEDI
jgi:hypothetical protein